MGEKLADCRDNALTKSSVLDFQNIGLQMLKVFVARCWVSKFPVLIGSALQSVEPHQIKKMLFDILKGVHIERIGLEHVLTRPDQIEILV
jgi:hypothetical protein